MNSTDGQAAPGAPLARIIPRSDHSISRAHISPNALRVLYRLREGGFQAFLVGGSVRDLLLGIEPKDFDVATDALPEQVRKLFRNCRLVGRRFRLAHVFFGNETIEVATFRASTAPSQGEEPPDAEDTEDAEPSPAEAAEGADLLDLEEDDEDGDDEEAASDEDPEAERSAAASSPSAPPPPASPPASAREAADGPRRSASPADARGVDDSDDLDRVLDAEGRILRDNVYGSIDDDVWRRDFTCNSLYYNIADFSVWDYVDGARDIEARCLRLIGDPETRYREDPVRMIRAARFEAKLGFSLAESTAEPIERLRGLLANVPPARLFDEVLKLFLTGHGARSLEVLRARGLLAELLPTVDDYLASHPDSLVEKVLLRGLRNTDERVAINKPVTPTFLFAVLLYGPIAKVIEATPPERWHELATILDACDRAVREAQSRIAIPRRFSLGIREMFALQPRLEHPRGRRALRVLEHPRFRAAFDLLLLRAEHGLASQEMVDWWARVQEASPADRAQMADALQSALPSRGGGSRRGPRRRRRRPRPASTS